MAKIEDMGCEEFYAEFFRVTGERGRVLVFVGEESEAVFGLAEEIGELLDRILSSKLVAPPKPADAAQSVRPPQWRC